MSVTDARLAELIADYGETCKRPPFECLSEVLACLRELQTRRAQERQAKQPREMEPGLLVAPGPMSVFQAGETED